jgi:hypothetical protein
MNNEMIYINCETFDIFMKSMEEYSLLFIKNPEMGININKKFTMNHPRHCEQQSIALVMSHFIAIHDVNKTLAHRDIICFKQHDNTTNLFFKPNRVKMPKNQSTRLCSCGKWASALIMKKCGRCKDVYYCSKECQTKDWAEHKTTCIKKD